MFAGSAVPPGYLYCDGASYLRADYPGLFAVIGTAFGAVDATHFNVPDYRDREPRGSKTIADSLGNDGLALASRAVAHDHAHSHSSSASVGGGISSAGTGTSITGGIAAADTNHNHTGPGDHGSVNNSPTSGGAVRLTTTGHGSTGLVVQAPGISHAHGHTFAISDPGHSHGHTLSVTPSITATASGEHPRQVIHFIIKT
jgi:microcystin-dependent protein